MNFQSLLAISITLTLTGALQAQETAATPAGLVIQPGLYDVTVSQTNSAFVNGERKTQPTQSRSAQQCLVLPNNLVLPKYYNKPGCSISIGDFDETYVSYKMNCQNGAQKFEGHFKMSSGHWGKFPTLDDFTTLPDQRRANKLFNITGTLGTKTGNGEAFQESEMLYTFVGPCPK